jgi:hypothetical protein
MGEHNSYTFNCDYSLHTPTKQYSHHIFNVFILHYLHPETHFLIVKINSFVIPEFKTFIITPCYITYIHYRKFSL